MAKEKYIEIYGDLRSKIEGKVYEAGQLLPSERELTEKYGCSRNTVRRALGRLTEEGYVQPQNGRGVRVIYRKTETVMFTVGGIENFEESATRNRIKYTTRAIEIRELVCDTDIASRTGFPVGEEIIFVRRVRTLNGAAAILDSNFFLKSVTGSLTKEIAERSIYNYLEKRKNIVISSSRRLFTAERACPDDYRYLDLADYDFVSVVTSNTFDIRGRMFEYTQSRHRPDYFAFADTAVRKPLG